MIIGLTGENCAGKGTVAAYLQKKSFYYFSLSDAIREELAREGKEVTRETLIAKGNELRVKLGADVLARRIMQKLQKDKNYVIDSIRNPHEAKALLELEDFTLVYISAPAEMRFERMKARNREGDPKSLEGFLAIDRIEIEGRDDKSQRLSDVIALASKKIMNDAGFEILYERVDRLLGELSASFKQKRPNWDAYFMGIAKVVSLRSNCMKRHVAAIIVKDKRIVSTGYNGTPRGVRNCSEGGCSRCNNFAAAGTKLEECVCSHGEENAIVQAAYHGISIKGGSIYSTFSPCLMCAKMIINAGIVEVVYNVDYPIGERAMELLREAGIIVRQHKVE